MLKKKLKLALAILTGALTTLADEIMQTPLLAALNSIQDGKGGGSPPTSFSPVPSTNVGISSQNYLTFNFNPFATLV